MSETPPDKKPLSIAEWVGAIAGIAIMLVIGVRTVSEVVAHYEPGREPYWLLSVAFGGPPFAFGLLILVFSLKSRLERDWFVALLCVNLSFCLLIAALWFLRPGWIFDTLALIALVGLPILLIIKSRIPRIWFISLLCVNIIVLLWNTMEFIAFPYNFINLYIYRLMH